MILARDVSLNRFRFLSQFFSVDPHHRRPLYVYLLEIPGQLAFIDDLQNLVQFPDERTLVGLEHHVGVDLYDTSDGFTPTMWGEPNKLAFEAGIDGHRRPLYVYL